MKFPPHSHRAAALAAGLVALPALLGASHPVAPASPASRGPALIVSVTDGRVAARDGDVLRYTLTVRDTGSAPAPDLKVTQTMPPGVRLVSASDQGRAKAGQVSWSVGLRAGREATFHVVTRVGRTPATLLRLAAVACVSLPGSERPAVCAAHLDRLPAATAALVSRPAKSGLGAAAYVAAALAVAVLGLLAAIAVRRRGPRRRAA
jgi:uncharacterized repeat protein (TIGR01451 family)